MRNEQGNKILLDVWVVKQTEKGIRNSQDQEGVNMVKTCSNCGSTKNKFMKGFLICNKCVEKENLSSNCKYWFAPKQECMKMTQILADNGVVDFHVSLAMEDCNTQGVINRRWRMCYGYWKKCLFNKCPDDSKGRKTR